MHTLGGPVFGLLGELGTHFVAICADVGFIPRDAIPVTGGKVGVIEKKHPVLYSTVRPATGFTLTDILDDKFDGGSSGVGDFEVEFRTHANNDKDGDGKADGALFTRSGA